MQPESQRHRHPFGVQGVSFCAA